VEELDEAALQRALSDGDRDLLLQFYGARRVPRRRRAPPPRAAAALTRAQLRPLPRL